MTHEKNLCRVYSIEMDKPTFLLDTNLSLSDRVTPFLFLEMMDKTIKEEEEIGSCWGEGGSFQLTEQLWMALSCNLDVEGNAGRNILSRLKNYYTLLTLHICRYNDPSRHNFENCLPSRFVSQRCLGRPLAAGLAKGALRDKSLKETNFKIRAQWFNVHICNVTLLNHLQMWVD